MTLETAFGALDCRLAVARPCPPGGTLLEPAAGDCLEMVRAYRADAATFAARGDSVNALAAVAYAFGWLDATVALGLVRGEGADCPPLAGVVPADRGGQLDEKSRRYAAMLEGAVAATAPAPDPASPARDAADAVLRVARCCSILGRARLDSDQETALSLLSYGYGWLDAGVRVGLVAIAGDRSLFAV